MSFGEEFQLHKLSLDFGDTGKFTVSQWRRLPDGVFLAWRVFWPCWHFVWGITSFISNTVYESKEDYVIAGSKWLIFLTNWSYTLLTGQSLLNLVIVLMARCTRRDKKASDAKPFVVKFLWLLTSVSYTAALDVTIFFWAFDYEATDSLHVYSVMVHTLNSVYVISDMMISATPVRLLHFIYPVIYAFLYLIFSVVFYLAHGTNAEGLPYIYQELDWSHPVPVAAFTLTSMVTVVPFTHLLFFGLYRLRLALSQQWEGSEMEWEGEALDESSPTLGSVEKQYKTMF